MVIQGQRSAIFDTYALVYATHWSEVLHTNRNQRCVGGQRRGACQLSSGLRRKSQKILQGIVRRTYVDVGCLNYFESSDVHESLQSTTRGLSKGPMTRTRIRGG